MFTRLPSDQELEKSGFLREDYEESVEVWPENWPAYEIFSMVFTQWHVEMDGTGGISYPVLFDIMDRKELKGDAWWQMFDDIRVMESAAMKARSK